MNRLRRLLLSAAVPVLLAPLGMFLADRLAPCRPTEQLSAAAPAVNDLALLLPAAAARLIAHRAARGQSPCSAETGAYCQARKLR